MAIAQTHDADHTSAIPPHNIKRSVVSVIGWGILFGLLAWSWEGADMRPMSLINDAANMSQFASGFFPPNFLEWRMYFNEILITIQIAIWGTVLAVVLSIPFGIMSSVSWRNFFLKPSSRLTLARSRASAPPVRTRCMKSSMV